MFPPEHRILAALIRHKYDVIRWEALVEATQDPVQLPSHHCNERGCQESRNKSLNRIGSLPVTDLL